MDRRYAVAMAFRDSQRIIYTSPLKVVSRCKSLMSKFRECIPGMRCRSYRRDECLLAYEGKRMSCIRLEAAALPFSHRIMPVTKLGYAHGRH